MSSLHTPLHSWHVANKARMVPFGGWDMPVQYSGIIEEHLAVRQEVGLFDISHMARLTLTGSDSEKLIETIFTNAVRSMKLGQVRYGLVCNDNGGILDDILVTKFTDHFALCVNASNREKIVHWLETHSGGLTVKLTDHTFESTMIALQGPKAIEIVAQLFPNELTRLKYYYAEVSQYHHLPCVVSRTGYTGEDGFEFIVPNSLGVTLWEEFTQRGAVPCGLGARDTLRLEAAMPLYGHELNESIDPLQAKLGWAVKLNKGDFIGKNALQNLATTTRPERVGLELEGKRAAREGSRILTTDGSEIGTVTSGSFVPFLKKSIAMGYINAEHTEIGTVVHVDLRGTQVPAKIVALPFYQRPQS